MILKKGADDVTNRVQVLYHKVGGKRLELRFLKSTHEEMWKCGNVEMWKCGYTGGKVQRSLRKRMMIDQDLLMI